MIDNCILPVDEAERIQAIRRYDILDTPPDGAFDRITALAARLFQVPIAIVSIVDSERIWFKSHHGLEVEQIGRDPGLCASAIMHDTPWILTDAPIDTRALSNPLVAGAFGLRFYAGAPLITADGHKLGTLCVIDKKSRTVTDSEIATLQDLAAVVMDELELRLASRRTLALEATLRYRALEEKERAERVANHDLLTGLPNRGYFLALLEREITRAHHRNEEVALHFLDLDRFKYINDSLGHQSGDELLVEVARRIRTCLSPEDIAARLGGDEFVVLQVRSNAHAAEGMAHRLVAILGQVYQLDGQQAHTSASVGIAQFPADSEHAAQLMRYGDLAMYYAKAKGRGNYQFYTADLNSESTIRKTLEINLRRALDNDAFELHYQPQKDLATGLIIGVEALLRWKDEQLAALSLPKLIGIAEDTGLIVPLGEKILLEACRQNRVWQEAGFSPISVAVNFSVRQFKTPNFVNMVRGILEHSRLEAKYLELEITEGLFMENTEANSAILEDLRALGIRITVDDFGTGFSALSYLKNFPVDVLKVDRSFVANLPHNRLDSGIAAAIIKLAHHVGVKVVAEGVETEEQLAFLQEQRCDSIQGFLFSPPVSEENMTVLFKAEMEQV